MKFKSDGCSGGMTRVWRLLLKRDPAWEGCCVAHDYLYSRGGDDDDRFTADVFLLQCVSENSRAWAVLMFLAVRIFGHRFFRATSPWKWTYGSPRRPVGDAPEQLPALAVR